jgi:hypothetical protein
VRHGAKVDIFQRLGSPLTLWTRQSGQEFLDDIRLAALHSRPTGTWPGAYLTITFPDALLTEQNRFLRMLTTEAKLVSGVPAVYMHIYSLKKRQRRKDISPFAKVTTGHHFSSLHDISSFLIFAVPLRLLGCKG